MGFFHFIKCMPRLSMYFMPWNLNIQKLKNYRCLYSCSVNKFINTIFWDSIYICYDNICPNIENRCVDTAGEEGDKLKSLPDTHTLPWLKCWRRLLWVPWTARRSNQSIIKEISPGCSLEGLMLKLKTPILWPPDGKSWLIWKAPDAGKDWGQEETGMTEDEMVGWHHQLNGHEFG